MIDKNKIKINIQLLKYRFLGVLHSFSLNTVQNNTKNIKPRDIILFCTLRNEGFRIEHFLSYYESLGVKHFVFVDNNSTDDFLEIVGERDNCSVWGTSASYKKSNFGMHWLNYLLKKYGSGHWCLTVDPDELLVYPYSEDRNLYELTDHLDSEKKESMFCLMLDMYSQSSISESHCAAGDNPLSVCSYFDPTGYVQRFNNHNWDMFIQGGPRRRVIFKDNPVKAPAMNKTPLIKWKKNYCYISSMHCALPKRLNLAHSGGHLLPTGCLLHFKFLAVLEKKAKEEIERKEHYDDSVEYKKYNNFISGDKGLFYPGSVKFKNSSQLHRLGLMNKGRWF